MNLFGKAWMTVLLAAGGLSGADFFPLQDGNTWTYRDAVRGQTFTVQVSAIPGTGDKAYYKLSGYTETDLLVRIDEASGALVYLDAATNQEAPLTVFAPSGSVWWKAPARLCTDEGQTMEKPAAHDGPAGPIAGVLEIRYRTATCADAGLVEEQYAEHLGMLRRTQTSIAGPRQFDLVHARVGNLVIDAPPVARFSLAVNPAASGVVTATLRLNTSAPLAITFPSGQEYDVVLKDRDGKILWTWSANLAFPQYVRQITVTGEWSATAEIPWPRGADDRLQPGAYTVEAWLTTAGDSPHFAATVPVTIPAN